MAEKTEQYKPQMRLITQASIPVSCSVEAEVEYANLRVFLLAISPDVTINAQIVKMLEPCCKKRKEKAPDEKAPETAK